MLSQEEIENNIALVRANFDDLAADKCGVLHRGSALIDKLLFRHYRRLSYSLLQTLRQIVATSPVEKLEEQLSQKNILLETLEAQIETLSERHAAPPAPNAIPVLDPAPKFVSEEEKPLLTSAIARELKKIDKLLADLENGSGEIAKVLPPPLALVKEMSLASGMRQPRPSEEENLMTLQKFFDRIKALPEKWQQSEALASSAVTVQSGWLQLDEAEVKELESTLSRLQSENEHLKARLADLEGNHA